jgi:hypothetical protein
MNLHTILASIVLAAAFTGCATFTPNELGQIRQHGVDPVVVHKFEQGQILTPADVIELTRHRVADDLIIRQIQDASVDYVLTRNDLRQLSAARVSREVVDALIVESDDFARSHSPADRVHVYAGYPVDPYYGYYGAPYPYYYPYGGVYVGGGYGHYHRWR